LSLGSGISNAASFLVIDNTASAAILALAGSYTPQGPSQCAWAFKTSSMCVAVIAKPLILAEFVPTIDAGVTNAQQFVG
jgi:hypothetical protein